MPTNKKFGKFLGLYDLDTPPNYSAIRIQSGPDSILLAKADNVNISNSYKVSRRSGRKLVLPGVQSIYSDGKVILGVLGGNLVQITPATNTPWPYHLIAGNVGTRPMSYCSAWNRIYFTNGLVIGKIVDGQAYTIAAISDPPFRRPLPPGTIIEAYRNRLYLARGRQIFFTDPRTPEHYDERRAGLQFSSEITMVKSVNDGLYISTKDQVSCFTGNSPDDFTRHIVSGSGAIPGTPSKTHDVLIGGKNYNTAVFWRSLAGIFFGSEETQTTNMTETRMKPLGSAINGAGAFIAGQSNRYIVITQ